MRCLTILARVTQSIIGQFGLVGCQALYAKVSNNLTRSYEISAFCSLEETPWERDFPELHQAGNNAPRFVYVFSELCFQPLP